MKIEVCTEYIDHALLAQKYGAHRIELCNNLSQGGSTPSLGQIEICRRILNIELYVLIRPRAFDFCYSTHEFESMCRDIEFCKAIGADGIVVGTLLPDTTLDVERMKTIKSIAGSMSVTFHRAFDVCKAPFETLELLIDLGIDRILSSGQANSAFEGIDMLKKLVQKADQRIAIMPGGGINTENIADISRISGAKAFHFSCHKKPLKGTSVEMNTFLDGKPAFDQQKLETCIKILKSQSS